MTKFKLEMSEGIFHLVPGHGQDEIVGTYNLDGRTFSEVAQVILQEAEKLSYNKYCRDCGEKINLGIILCPDCDK